MLHDAHLTDIRAQRKKSTCPNARPTRRVSKQRSADASEPNDSAHQGEWECHTGLQPARAAMRMAHYAAISPAVHEAGCDPLAITPILVYAAPELLARVKGDVFGVGTCVVDGCSNDNIF